MFRPWRPALIVAILSCPLGACADGTFSPLDLSANASAVAGADTHAVANSHVSAPPQLAKAKTYFRDRNFGLAQKSYRAAVEAAPDNVEAWMGLAASCDELGRFDLADRAYDQALRLTGPTAQFLNNRGYSHLMRGDYGKARRDLTAARAKDPGNKMIARNIALLP